MCCEIEIAVLQRKFASCQAILDSNLLNMKGRSPIHMSTEWEFARLVGFLLSRSVMREHHYRHDGLNEYLIVLIFTETYQRNVALPSLLKTILSCRCRHLCLPTFFCSHVSEIMIDSSQSPVFCCWQCTEALLQVTSTSISVLKNSPSKFCKVED